MERKRFSLYVVVAMALVVLVIFAVIVWKMFYNQANRGKWIDLSGDYTETVDLEATRGNIFSCDGQLLASSIPYYNMYWDSKADKQTRDSFPKYVDTLSLELSKVLKNKNRTEWRSYLNNEFYKGNRNSLIAKKVSYTDMKRIKKMPFFDKKRGISGLIVEEVKRRNNPFGEIAALGKLSVLERGNRGIELKYDSILKGENGVGVLQKIAGSKEIYPMVDAKDGLDIVTTVDGEIQDIAHQELQGEMERINAINGCMVLMEVETGEVKACVNLQRLDDGSYYDGTNVAVQKVEPGSTFKTISMMVALDKGIVKPDDMVDATNTGVKEMYGVRMTDSHVNGVLTMQGVIEQSSNIGMSTVIDDAFHKNPDDFVDAVYDLGITKDMKLEIWGYQLPNIKKKSDPNVNWSEVSLPFMAIGYETEISPIYMLSFYNAIANSGRLIKPFFVKEIRNNGVTVERKETEVLNEQICSASTLAAIQRMLEGVVMNGTGKPVRSNRVKIAGKTGTAQADNKTAHRVTFCGYFPADKPKYSAIVMMYAKRLGNTASGGGMSGVVFKRVAEKVHARRIAYTASETILQGKTVAKVSVKNGNVKLAKEVLKGMDVNVNGDKKARWGTMQSNEANVTVEEMMLEREKVPNVVGMGAKDAVYLMETLGVRTSLVGKGKVLNQSIAPGSRPHKGDIIYLTLR